MFSKKRKSGYRAAFGAVSVLHSNINKIIKRRMLSGRLGKNPEPQTKGYSILSLPLVYSFPLDNVNQLIGLTGIIHCIGMYGL